MENLALEQDYDDDDDDDVIVILPEIMQAIDEENRRSIRLSSVKTLISSDSLISGLR